MMKSLLTSPDRPPISRVAPVSPQRITSALAGVAVLVLFLNQGAAQEATPSEWLQRMTGAVQTVDYEGTVIRMRNGQVEALKVVHVVSDGVVHEKVTVQEGNGLEIIRTGNEVQCILPDKTPVLVE